MRITLILSALIFTLGCDQSENGLVTLDNTSSAVAINVTTEPGNPNETNMVELGVDEPITPPLVHCSHYPTQDWWNVHDDFTNELVFAFDDHWSFSGDTIKLDYQLATLNDDSPITIDGVSIGTKIFDDDGNSLDWVVTGILDPNEWNGANLYEETSGSDHIATIEPDEYTSLEAKWLGDSAYVWVWINYSADPDWQNLELIGTESRKFSSTMFAGDQLPKNTDFDIEIWIWWNVDGIRMNPLTCFATMTITE